MLRTLLFSSAIALAGLPETGHAQVDTAPDAEEIFGVILECVESVAHRNPLPASVPVSRTFWSLLDHEPDNSSDMLQVRTFRTPMEGGMFSLAGRLQGSVGLIDLDRPPFSCSIEFYAQADTLDADRETIAELERLLADWQDAHPDVTLPSFEMIEIERASALCVEPTSWWYSGASFLGRRESTNPDVFTVITGIVPLEHTPCATE